ncbi:hypothetical protein CAOG_009942 [Capsaspora owczarzaki ATCC 30864]|uniref:Mitochondrial carrier n=1 Tax=Capsaspora owczarzaki (strain ATCC 30864) TaxID=595528 RepID=A0A0D2X490_CAPO3|nr:hypothetical protein CAOG_009942 [Capsaspora owczarzaki ATCC 30864]
MAEKSPPPRTLLGPAAVTASSTVTTDVPVVAQPAQRQSLGSSVQHFVASGIASGLARFTTHPFDTIRTRLQVHNHGTSHAMGHGGDRPLGVQAQWSAKHTGEPSRPPAHLTSALRQTWACGRSIVAQEGVRGLYSGVGIAMGIGAPALATYLFTYDEAKKYISSQLNAGRGHLASGHEGLATHLLAGVTAEVVSGLFWTPMEVIKQRLQAAGGELQRYKSSTHAFKTIVAQEGIRGMYRGYFTTLTVFIPHSAIFFVTFEQLKLLALRIRGHRPLSDSEDLPPLSFSTTLGISTTAASIAALMTNPLDVIKTRWQVQVGTTALANGVVAQTPWLGLSYASPLDAALRIVREEGWRALTQGMAARALWLAPATAVSISCYEAMKHAYFSED